MINKKWTTKEKNLLIANYPINGKSWCMEKLARSNGSIRQMASDLGLKQDRNSDFFKEWQSRARKSKIGKKRPIQSEVMKQRCLDGDNHLAEWGRNNREVISKRSKEWHKNNEHPKGFKGEKHTVRAKEKMSIAAKVMWNDKTHRVNSEEYRQMISDRITKQATFRKPENMYSRGRQGKYDINGRVIYFRSSWEPNYALYLDCLIKKNQIKKWEYEPDTFWFEKVRRGVRSYKPDFKVFNNNGSFEYHEVKGWLDPKSKTKIKRMAKYYPEIKLILIDKEPYTDIKNKLGAMLKFY